MVINPSVELLVIPEHQPPYSTLKYIMSRIRFYKQYSIIFFLIYSLCHIIVVSSTSAATCTLCLNPPIHAPCLLNIETGALTELQIYEPHPMKPGELSPKQQGGHFRIFMSDGITIMSDPGLGIARTTIPYSHAQMNKSKFCRRCRKLLAGTERTYTLVDAYSQESIKIYSICDKTTLTMRCYTVTSLIDGKNRLNIYVQAKL